MEIQPAFKDTRSSSLSLHLSSNNPFRNRAASPNLPTSPSDAPPRPVSRNPFLDVSSTNMPPPQITGSTNDASGAPRSALTGNAAELFDNLTLTDKRRPSNGGMRPAPPRPNGDKNMPGQRAENIPPRGPPMHRPTRSQEEAMRARRAANGGGQSRPRPSQELNIFADPSESPRRSADRRRPRRNSDSSVMERGPAKPLDPEEEKRRQERRRRERKHREQREQSRDPKSKKPDRKLDIIDQLDATSIYGTGLFHHDGPFDACNPHRNRTGSKRAPMQAFPKDSLNNILGGGGPLNKRPDHATFLGNNDEEAFKDYARGGSAGPSYEGYGAGASRGAKTEPNVQSALQKVELVHGEESMGLGTSTFLEGAPASRTAIQKREVEASQPEFAGGLQRKKSLAQKIRGINSRRDYGPSGRITSPEGVYSPTSPEVLSPGGTRMKSSEPNPFFNEFGPSPDKKSEGITIVEPENKPSRPPVPSSPGRRGPGERLERRVTSDATSPTDEQSKPMGFLSRVKSLKGGPRKPRGEPRPT